MSCSPLLDGVTDPLDVLRVIRDNPVLCYSESPSVFVPLQERGWAVYEEGRWQLTEEGKAKAGSPTPKAAKPPAFLGGFFKVRKASK